MPDVRFILGRAGSGKTTTIVNDVVAMLAADPLGDPIYVLVPDQATLLYERLIAKASPTGGYLRVRVTTFREVIERLLTEAGGEAIPEVTPLGRRILIGRLLRRLEPQLTFYRSTARQPGLAGKLDDAFAELENSDADDASIDALATTIATEHPQSSLPAKLRDIRLLFREYESLLGSDRLDPRRRLIRALDAIDHCPTVPRVTLFVDGFYDFTRPERQLIFRLAAAGCRTTIALDVDPRDVDAAADDPLSPTHPLRASTHAYRRLSRAFLDASIIPHIDAHRTNPRFVSQELLHVERNFDRPRPGKLDAAGHVRRIETAGRDAEVDAAARQILDWLAAGLRLRDVVVLARDANEYAAAIEASFRAHRIPFFIDRQESAGHQPLLRTIRAMMQLALSDWSPERVLELLKAGLVGVDADSCDAVENFVIAHRIRGRAAWNAAWRYRTRKRRDADDDDEAAIAEREDVANMNRARRHLVDALEPLLGPDGDRAPTSDWCQRICRALDRLGVRAELAKRIDVAERAGDVEGALRAREVWHEFSELLDQLCTVLSGEPLTLREFAEVVDVALERFMLAIVPPTIDQVLVGSVDRTRTGPVRACIVLGLNEGQFPRRAADVDAFSDDDRRLLADRAVEVRADSRAALLDEQFLAYLAVTRPSEKLTLIRSAVDDAGKALAPSIFWNQIGDCFRALPAESIADAADPSRLSTPGQLVDATLRWAAADSTHPTELRLSRWLFDSASGAVAALRDAMLRGLTYDNAARLTPSVAARLYPSPLRGSATRLETFASCPFKHFAQHALRLSPREEADLTRMEVGTMYHRVLENLVRDALAERHDLSSPVPDLESRISALGHAAALELKDELLLTPGRTQHLIEAMERTLQAVADTQRHVLALGAFRPSHAEMGFGGERAGEAPPLVIDTPGGRRVELRGKVDRIDTLDASDAVAATVVDYKLTGRPVSFDRIFHGLSLQLVTYLLVLTSVGERWIGRRVVPAAALYVTLARGIERVAHPSDAPAPLSPEFAMHKSHRARGLVDDRYAHSLDHATESGWSPAYSLTVSAKPIDLRRHDVLEHETFLKLIEWSRTKIAALADQIVDGTIAVRPYRIGTQTPCAHCDFRPVCRLDLAFNDYYFIPSTGDETLRQIVGDVEETR